MPLSWAAAQKIKQKLRKAAKIKINILKEVNTFHYKAEDNCVLAKHINGVVFKKAGSYIFALGLAQFCCHISLFLCIKSICAYQNDAYEQELQNMEPHERIMNESWINSHRFQMMKIGRMLGNVVFMSKVEGIVLIYPSIPFFILFAMAMGLLVVSLTISMHGIQSMIPFFLSSIAIGAADGTMFAAFLFHAVSHTDVPSSIHLNFRERELVVNFLLIAQNMGRFFGMLAAHLYFVETNPMLVYQQPK